jgi:hypothetical protein
VVNARLSWRSAAARCNWVKLRPVTHKLPLCKRANVKGRRLFALYYKMLCPKTTHTARVQEYLPCRYKVMVPSRKAPRGKHRAQILGPYRS